jgi:hypothetical protein
VGYWKAEPLLIWTDADLDLFATNRFRVADGGAAGNLFEPFNQVASECMIYTFEARGEEAISYLRRINVDAGL